MLTIYFFSVHTASADTHALTVVRMAAIGMASWWCRCDGGGSCAYFCVTFQSISIFCLQWRMAFVNVRHFRFPFEPLNGRRAERQKAGTGTRAGSCVLYPVQIFRGPWSHSATCQSSRPRPLHHPHRPLKRPRRMSLTNLMSNIFLCSLPHFFMKSIFWELELASLGASPKQWANTLILGVVGLLPSSLN